MSFLCVVQGGGYRVNPSFLFLAAGTESCNGKIRGDNGIWEHFDHVKERCQKYSKMRRVMISR